MSASARPVIGINVDLVAATKHATAYIRLSPGYFDSIYTAGGLPILIPPLNKEKEIDAILDRVDGIVLCGGPDLDPRRQNLPTHSTVVPMPPRREDNDRLLLRRVVDRQIPVLGIGVGMQQINAHFGGALFLHIPEDMPRATDYVLGWSSSPLAAYHTECTLTDEDGRQVTVGCCSRSEVNLLSWSGLTLAIGIGLLWLARRLRSDGPAAK